MSGEMIERVAKAIIDTMFEEHELPLEDAIYEKYLVTADAGMSALHQPTEAMLDAARDWSAKKYGVGIGNKDAIGCWQAMLAAARGNPPT